MSIRRPRLRASVGARAPKGWGPGDISPIARTPPGLSPGPPSDEPAGDPPPWWRGSRPEWAIYWGLLKLGKKPGIDFIYQAEIPGLGSGDTSLLDFYLPEYALAIEVQGTFWHVELGTESQVAAEIRRAIAASQGITMVFIGEEDALKRPVESIQRAFLYQDTWLAETQ